MPRHTTLQVTIPNSPSAVSSTVTSPTEGESGVSSPRSITAQQVLPGGTIQQNQSTKGLSYNTSEPQSPLQTSPDITSLPAFPPSPKEGQKSSRDTSKGFFSNLKASKSSNKIQSVEPTIRSVDESNRRQADTLPHPIYSSRQNSGSTRDLSLSKFDLAPPEDRQGTSQRKEVPRRQLATSRESDNTITPSLADPSSNSRKPKPLLRGFIGRTRSTRVEEVGRRSKPSTPISTTGPLRRMQYDGNSDNEDSKGPPKTAPINPNHSLRDIMNSGIRGQSAERQPSNHSSEHVASRRAGPPNFNSYSTSNLSNPATSAFREGAGSHLLLNIKNTADGLGKAGKGLFSRKTRRPSSTGKDDEPYVLKVINLPLVQQTRRTRIAARLEDSKDKTEFWMPALPWRCIDYLNFRGCEEEGLYRIPGSEKEVRVWQKRFDREGDINLFDESELYDINTIGSMFKSWLRELPTEIFPKDIQAKVARECADAQQVPQLLKDELSRLPPWNYYLLFAITCHLSLLAAYSDKNKMTYSNLCICFQPAVRIDAFCFNFLVNKWRDCWQGCFTEKEFLEEEYRALDGLPSSSGESSNDSTAMVEDQSLPLPLSDKAMTSRTQQGRPPALDLTRAGDQPPPSTPARVRPEVNGHTRTASQLPELAQLSPLMGEY